MPAHREPMITVRNAHNNFSNRQMQRIIQQLIDDMISHVPDGYGVSTCDVDFDGHKVAMQLDKHGKGCIAVMHIEWMRNLIEDCIDIRIKGRLISGRGQLIQYPHAHPWREFNTPKDWLISMATAHRMGVDHGA